MTNGEVEPEKGSVEGLNLCSARLASGEVAKGSRLESKGEDASKRIESAVCSEEEASG